MMKALSVTQPWASVICSGLKDVENRTWQPAKAPGRILIHATSAKVVKNFEGLPDDQVSTIKNARLFGHIPEYEDMPYGAIIGYVDCYKIVKGSDSFWAQPNCFHWCLRDAMLFDEPITGVKGARGRLFDVDLDENNLPAAHKVDLTMPIWDGKCLEMPASDAVINAVRAGEKEFLYELCDTSFELFIDPTFGEVYPTDTIKFIGKDCVITKEVELIGIGPYLDMDGNPVLVNGYAPEEEVYWSYVGVLLK